MTQQKDNVTQKRTRGAESLLDYLIFGGPALIFATLWLLFEVQDAFSPVLAAAYDVKIDWAKRDYTVRISPVLSFVIVALFYLCVSFFAYIIKVKTKNLALKEKTSELAAVGGELQRLRGAEVKAKSEVEGATLAVEQIVNRLYSIDRPRWRFTRVIAKYEIDVDGNGAVELLYDIEAGPVPAHIWRFSIDADSSADPVQWLDEIDLKVESLDRLEGKEVRYLLFRNHPHSKRLAIFFLPEISAGETRKVKISYRWPGLARDLLVLGKTNFVHQFNTCDPKDAAEIEYTYLFKAGIGGLEIHNVKPALAGDSLVEVSEAGRGMMGWRYSNRSLPMENRQIGFAITRTPPLV
ncbi:MAG TPA: hypothetical protein VF138_03160 [Caulobacteraceae bacterium]